MKPSVMLAAVAGLMIPLTATAADELPTVEALRNGFYVSNVDLDGRIVKTYTVDSVAQLCFSLNVVIPCKNLKLREEWKQIITWVSE